jgi:pilus assembly protein Flp/PilA
MQSRLSLLARSVLRFLRDESGPTAVEYVLLLAVIFVVCVSAIQWIGNITKNSYQNSANKITGAGS